MLSERWLNITGSTVEDLTTNPEFQKTATKIKYLPKFKEIVFAQRYGARYRSYLFANETGNFTFYTFCDDSCQLFLSSGINPRNKKMIIDQPRRVPAPNKSKCCE